LTDLVFKKLLVHPCFIKSNLLFLEFLDFSFEYEYWAFSERDYVRGKNNLFSPELPLIEEIEIINKELMEC